MNKRNYNTKSLDEVIEWKKSVSKEFSGKNCAESIKKIMEASHRLAQSLGYNIKNSNGTLKVAEDKTEYITTKKVKKC